MDMVLLALHQHFFFFGSDKTSWLAVALRVLLQWYFAWKNLICIKFAFVIMQCGGVTFDSRCKIAVSIKQMKSSCLLVIACHNNSINHLIENMKRIEKKAKIKNWKNEYGSRKLAQNEFINIQIKCKFQFLTVTEEFVIFFLLSTDTMNEIALITYAFKVIIIITSGIESSVCQKWIPEHFTTAFLFETFECPLHQTEIVAQFFVWLYEYFFLHGFASL